MTQKLIIGLSANKSGVANGLAIQTIDDENSQPEEFQLVIGGEDNINQMIERLENMRNILFPRGSVDHSTSMANGNMLMYHEYIAVKTEKGFLVELGDDEGIKYLVANGADFCALVDLLKETERDA